MNLATVNLQHGSLVMDENNHWTSAKLELASLVQAANEYMVDLPPIYRPFWAKSISEEVAVLVGGIPEVLIQPNNDLPDDATP